MSPPIARDRANRAAQTDTPEALRLARGVRDPWFRCQALAWVARYAPQSQAVAIADEAVEVGSADADPHRRAASAAWPIRALIERGEPARALRLLSDALHRAAEIPHPVRRLDALFLLWQAAFPMGAAAREPVQRLLVHAAEQANSWKAGYVVRDMVLMLRPQFAGDPGQLVNLVPDGKFRRQAARRLGLDRTFSPRPFFW